MDIAARGVHRESFRRNRYYLTANRKNIPSHGNAPSQGAKTTHLSRTVKQDSSKNPDQITSPWSMPLSDTISAPKSAYQIRPTTRSGPDVQISGPESEPGSNSFDHTGIVDRKSSSSDGDPLTQTAKPDTGFTLPQDTKNFKHWSLGRSKPSKPLALRQVDCSHRGNSGNNGGNEEEEEEEEEEDIGLHMWEKGETVAMEVPWFRCKVDA